jgi:hypothetical protein
MIKDKTRREGREPPPKAKKETAIGFSIAVSQRKKGGKECRR